MNVTIILRGESSETRVRITEFSMLEPSAFHCRFRNAEDGEVLEAHGLLISFEGDVDSLPPCIYNPTTAICGNLTNK